MNDHDLPPEPTSRRAGSPSWLRYAIPIAAGALLVALLPRFARHRSPEVNKMPAATPAEMKNEERRPPQGEPAPGTSSVIVALFPFGTFAEPPPKFTWTRDPLATTYRLELLDQSEKVFFTKETADTTFGLPPDDPAWLQIGSWRVTPILGRGTTGRPSDPMLIRIDPSLR
ncbi:MAG TPA: hypothetical protein VFR10_10265 [bacterium]|nr:hypothetical protein [bacterium]